MSDDPLRLHHAFKIQYQGVTRTLVTPVAIRAAKSLYGDRPPGRFDAVWDTGATHSCISEKVAADLALPQSGIRQIKGVNSEGEAPTYMVDLLLPNRVSVVSVEVAAVRIDCAVLIGMGIIGLGDFVVCNHGGTEFSFSMPAHEHKFDLVERSNKLNVRVEKAKRKKR